MAARLLLDTDVLVEYLRGRRKAIDYVEGLTSGLYISVVTVAELFAGIRGDEEEQTIRQFLLVFDVLPVAEEVARLGGIYRRDFGPSHGTGLADSLIAATVEEIGAALVTFNRKHFPMVETIAPYER